MNQDAITTPRSEILASIERRPRLAIVSTYYEHCGIAGYTRALEQQLAEGAEVKVFDLDQYLLRSRQKRVIELGNRHIDAIADELKNFDSVNIQLEHGTLGLSPLLIMRRFRRLMTAAPAVSVTFHTVLNDAPIPWEAISHLLGRGRLIAAVTEIFNNRRASILSRGVYGLLRTLQKRKHVSAIVHTRRDAQLLKHVFRLDDVYHHPLTFVSRTQARAIAQSTARDDFPLLRNIPRDVKLVGTFGFLSAYKGHQTAIRALHLLPENFHLIICGAVHPQTIKRLAHIDPYVAELLRSARIGESTIDHLKETKLPISVAGSHAELLGPHPENLAARLHFLGAASDEGFMKAMSICDAVVFPYIEVGQSSSGPIAMATDMGVRVIASRTHAFMAFEKYHPGAVEFFDIGNHAELAGLLGVDRPNSTFRPPSAYNTTTNAALYLKIAGNALRFL